jgi:hypothetical protein
MSLGKPIPATRAGALSPSVHQFPMCTLEIASEPKKSFISNISFEKWEPNEPKEPKPWYPNSAESVAAGDIVRTRGGRSTGTG